MIVIAGGGLDYLAQVTKLLDAEGLCVQAVDTGPASVDSIAAIRPELILLDIRSPGLEGLDVCRRIKAREDTRDIPIVLLSGADEAKARAECLKLGAADFLPEPIQREELVARIRTQLELCRLRRDLEGCVAERTADLRLANSVLETQLGERMRSERALRERAQDFQKLADRAPVGIWVMGADRRLLFRNKRGLAFAGKGKRQIACDGWTAVVHPDDLESLERQYAAAVEKRRAFRIECRMRGADGALRWLLHTGIPRFSGGAFAGYIGASIDITDLKRNHERAVAAEKLESLGALAAGIAHDFNNLVGSIFAASDLALSDLPAGSPARANIERINIVATRASEIVNLLMTYAGEYGVRLERIDLSLVAAEILELLKGTVSRKVLFETSLASGLPAVCANVTQVRQVILNLIMNACESMESGEGAVTVKTGYVLIARANSEQEPPPGEYCRLTVADTGRGMTAEVCARALDPFYSTKFIGRGLGLAVVQGIVRSLGGAVNITTAPGEGTIFEILLPCAENQADNSVHISQAVAGSDARLFTK